MIYTIPEWERKAEEALEEWRRITHSPIPPQFNEIFLRGYDAGYEACLKIFGLLDDAKDAEKEAE